MGPAGPYRATLSYAEGVKTSQITGGAGLMVWAQGVDVHENIVAY